MQVEQVQQTYAKLLASLPSMFESSPTTSYPEISLDALKSLTEMALFGHSLFLTPPTVTTTSPIIGGRTIASPEPISGDEKEKEVAMPIQACLGCQATDTPEWRRGPLGPRTLCNACVSGEGGDLVGGVYADNGRDTGFGFC